MAVFVLGAAVGVALGRRIAARTTARKLESQRSRLVNLNQIDRAILRADSVEDLATAALGRVRELAGADRSSLALDESGARRVIFALDDRGLAPFALGRRFGLDEMLGFAAEDGIAPDALLSKQTLLVPDLARLRSMPSSIRLSLDAGSRTILSVALVADEVLLGRLSALSRTPGKFGPDEVELLEEVAAQLAVAVQAARLRDELRRHATELEERVRERTARLEEINAELDAFSYTVSHDLRAPLRAVQGFADALLEDYARELPAEGQEYARRVVGAAQRMDRLIQDLLAYSRASRNELSIGRVELDKVVADAIERQQADVWLHEAQVRPLGTFPAARGNHAALVQVVANLLGNALKFVANDRPSEVTLRAERADGRVRLWVEDNGIGIAPEHQERIFAVFTRLSAGDRYPGTGIGLAIVRRVMARLSGRAGVLSTPNVGSRFWIELPAAD
jgi:signal transduction histidine kinase